MHTVSSLSGMLFSNIVICNKQLGRGEIAIEKFSEAYCTSLRCYIVQFIFLSLFCHDVAMLCSIFFCS